MKGLLRKDFYLLWYYSRMLPVLVFGFILFSAFASSGESPFFTYYPCILGSALSINLLAYDESEHWCGYCDTLPVTRRQYVSGKYIIAFLCSGVIFLLSAAAAAVRFCRSGSWNLIDWGDQAAVLATIAFLPAALCLPLLFKYGAQKGRIAFIAVIGCFCGLTVVVDMPQLSGLSLPVVLLPILALIIFAASWLLSIRFYQKREI